jgi:intracellular sulfur oxidation DsrE/DsrF family protein
MRSKKYFLLLALLILTQLTFAQKNDPKTGPVIKDYGPTWAIDNPDFKTNPKIKYKVVFDIHNTPEDPAAINPMLTTLARFMNMHAAAGVPLKNLKAVGVIHNRASVDAMNNEAYREKFGVDNPNIPLMEALEEAGVKIYMCGQSINARGIDPDRMAAPVKTALSAMTVFLSLQSEGYQLIKF